VVHAEQQLDAQGLLREILQAREAGQAVDHLAARFHLTLPLWVERVARQAGLTHITFSGGVFQNALLVDLMIDRLSPRFSLYFHQQLSPNDENIAFGQIMLWGVKSLA
jgi:hydrogenase maturation protein HypF